MNVGHTEEQRDIYTITRLNREVRAVLEDSFPPSLWVRGEISNLAQPGSGHLYFSLKDKHSQVRCAMFRGANRHLRFAPENGQEVLVRAGVSLYEGRGEFQLIVESMEPAGAGALQQAFEKLKQRLLEEGLFAEEHKQPIPAFPGTIGVITSPTGAAVKDIIHVLERRYARADVIVYPAPVQGEGSAQQIAQAIDEANRRRECDVLILARGGGSLEDLWSFNEEIVARAVHSSAIPVVSGIGHEIDFTIADFVADQRAPTPSAAAEMVSPDSAALKSTLNNLYSQLHLRIAGLLAGQLRNVTQLRKRLPHPTYLLQNMTQRMDDLAVRMRLALDNGIALRRVRLNRFADILRGRSPLQRLAGYRNKCSALEKQLQNHLMRSLHARTEQLDYLSRSLKTVSPLATLERGYAIVTDEDENIVRQADQLQENAKTTTRFAKGSVESTVNRIKPSNKLSSTLLMPILEESEDELFERSPDNERTVEL